MIHGTGSLAWVIGSEFVSVRGIDYDLGGRGEVVVDAHAFELPRSEGSLNSGELGDGHAVGEFEGIEAHGEDFIDHFFAISVAGVVPAG